MSVRIENQVHEQISVVHDDLDESFMRFCESGDRTSVRRGIGRHGHTMLNSFQLKILLEEFDTLPHSAKLPVLREVAEGAYLAIRCRGYLWFSGD